MFTLIEQPHFITDGVEIAEYDYLLDPAFCALQDRVYDALTPARNATNELCRGIRWGIWLGDTIQWSTKDTYQLGGSFNSEEEGRVRTMDLLPDEFVEHPLLRRVFHDVFDVYYPSVDRAAVPHMIQLSAIRYEPTPQRACYPSPDMPHQDEFDSAVVVLQKTPNLVGGQSRIYTTDERLRYEADLKPGQALLVRDEQWKHQVVPMTYGTGTTRGRCLRDILIVRIDPVDR